MIVKNEEKNIEKALSWAKDIAFEQIVVDTGSTDRTVEIAESIGAKVYHFEWINDFSAAKNFAIEKCSGNWIAFLDEDEYFNDEDAKKILPTLRQIEAVPMKPQIQMISCPLLNAQDDGSIITMESQIRLFRNIPDVRYTGTIHEHLTSTGHIYQAEDITIIHTGYSQSAKAAKNISERNIALITTRLNKTVPDAVQRTLS